MGVERESPERSRSRDKTGDAAKPLPKGTAVQFFHEADPADPQAVFVRPQLQEGTFGGAKLLQSHGWLNGKLVDDYDPAAFDEANQNTWPLVGAPPKGGPQLVARGNSAKGAGTFPRRARRVREVTKVGRKAPELSLVFVRWGGEYAKNDEEENDGDWGKYGSPPSNEYMSALVREGLMAHPQLVDESRDLCDFELYSLFVSSSREVLDIIPGASRLAAMLKGNKKTCFWMLWPAEWQDFVGDPDYACYIERTALFNAMRACEAAGLRSGFPHPADLYEAITSKAWMATLSLHPLARLPAAVLVSKESVVNDVEAAASNALQMLENIRAMSPFPRAEDDPPAPSVVNKDVVQKGVVKLGWSWENRFVSIFNSKKQLQARLKMMFSQPGCLASSCIVQEWVDFDFEMRLFFLPPSEWRSSTVLQPACIECNAWGERSQEDAVGSSHAGFSKLNADMCIERWSGDAEAWAAAKEETVQVSQFLLAWLRTVNAQPVPMIRLDFMVRRLRPGKVRVVFGEYCELGACCLGWKEGPPTIWRAALDAALR